MFRIASPLLSRISAGIRIGNNSSSSSMTATRSYNRLLEGIDANQLVRDVKAPIPSGLEPIFNLTNASNKEIVRFRKTEAMKKYQRHEIDTGSTSVQIAIITERIHALTVHFIKHRLDVSTKRSYDRLIHRRRDLLKYLKRTNFDEFAKVVKSLKLEMAVKQL